LKHSRTIDTHVIRLLLVIMVSRLSQFVTLKLRLQNFFIPPPQVYQNFPNERMSKKTSTEVKIMICVQLHWMLIHLKL